MKLIHEYVLEALLIDRRDIRVFTQQLEQEFQQVVVVDHLLFQLHCLILSVDIGNFLRHIIQKREVIIGLFIDRATSVARIADHVGNHLGLWIVFPFDEFGVNRVDRVLQQALCFAFVENGIVTL